MHAAHACYVHDFLPTGLKIIEAGREFSPFDVNNVGGRSCSISKASFGMMIMNINRGRFLSIHHLKLKFSNEGIYLQWGSRRWRGTLPLPRHIRAIAYKGEQGRKADRLFQKAAYHTWRR